jgi:hypothetical protein
MRIGGFTTGLSLVNAKLVDERYRYLCPHCKEHTPETIEHVILDCEKWDVARLYIGHMIRDIKLKFPLTEFSCRQRKRIYCALVLGGVYQGWRVENWDPSRTKQAHKGSMTKDNENSLLSEHGIPEASPKLNLRSTFQGISDLITQARNCSLVGLRESRSEMVGLDPPVEVPEDRVDENATVDLVHPVGGVVEREGRVVENENGYPADSVKAWEAYPDEDDDLSEIFEFERCGAKLVSDFLWCISGTRTAKLKKLRKRPLEGGAEDGQRASPPRPGPDMSKADENDK